ncbi:GNAT family N-acetyltransferase [Alkaliphilus hydrothermalis]|uniref:RimJ/RimL family protein N-acetyltransferase n=1 Tax=Alkaliphilus hydrothermalis TaxID=1482730 RepID=A0ABS2NR21_9FIRM|nr:GNAT family N-acetyltransferase [Alkaliphilus hydrothermalis]MBM7615408.1 RimJ/RimL family protein N-acetyltransferase [Alkaliphilus hydrothermalis]
MIKLRNEDYRKVAHLVKSQNELSVFSVINGVMSGEIYVNNIENPTSALIQTSECNLIAGSTEDEAFNAQVSSELDFWDQLTPDSSEWIDIIPKIHENSFIRKYKRRRYIISMNDFVGPDMNLPEGFVMEKVDLSLLREKNLENSGKVLGWAENWNNDEEFKKYGTGYYIHNNEVIVSWSLSDCSFSKSTAIGVHTDDRFRNKGFAKKVAAATIKDSFEKGYENVEWLCVDSNKGSTSMADKLGFTYSNDYDSFSSYPPIENPTDLSKSEWYEWAEYLEEASKTHDCLLLEGLYAYVNSNDMEKAMDIMNTMEDKEIKINYIRLKNYINKLQNYGMCSNFHDPKWIDLLDEKIESNK